MTITRASVVVFLAFTCGCAGPVATAGLANAPKLGTSPSHERPPYDVVANGQESCERAPEARGRIWSSSPPCTASEAVTTPALFAIPRRAPSSRWIPRSPWSLPPCAALDESGEPLVVASCCPAGETCEP
jgi:hypothetical protein